MWCGKKGKGEEGEELSVGRERKRLGTTLLLEFLSLLSFSPGGSDLMLLASVCKHAD